MEHMPKRPVIEKPFEDARNAIIEPQRQIYGIYATAVEVELANPELPGNINTSDTSKAKAKPKRRRNVLGYSRESHDKDMRRVNFLMRWMVANVARVALRAETYNGKRKMGEIQKEQYVEKLWKRSVRNTVTGLPYSS